MVKGSLHFFVHFALSFLFRLVRGLFLCVSLLIVSVSKSQKIVFCVLRLEFVLHEFLDTVVLSSSDFSLVGFFFKHLVEETFLFAVITLLFLLVQLIEMFERTIFFSDLLQFSALLLSNLLLLLIGGFH